MTDSPRVRLYQLACEAACLIATAPDPAQARQKFLDDLTEELLAGAVNLAGSQALLSAFRDAMGYSVRVDPADGWPPAASDAVLADVPDVLGEESVERRVHPGSVRGSVARTSPDSSPSALGERGDKPHAGGATTPRSPSPLRVVEEGDAP